MNDIDVSLTLKRHEEAISNIMKMQQEQATSHNILVERITDLCSGLENNIKSIEKSQIESDKQSVALMSKISALCDKIDTISDTAKQNASNIKANSDEITKLKYRPDVESSKLVKKIATTALTVIVTALITALIALIKS